MATTMKLIGRQVLSAAASSVTFSDIPATYDDLYLVYSVRSERAVTTSDMLISFNSSTSNFSMRELYSDGASAFSLTGASFARYFGVACGTSATSNTFSTNEAYIPNYAGSTNKSYSVTGATETNATTAYIVAVAGLWSNTAAITSITLTEVGSFNLGSGSSFFLYGIKKA